MKKQLAQNRLARFEQKITSTSALWLSFAAYLLLTFGFVVIMYTWDFQVIDELFVADEILAHIGAMTDSQKQVHAITTATIDVAYPFAYGAFQAGMAYRYLGRWGRWIAPLSLICIPVDLLEGFAQVMLLNGAWDFVHLKAVITPVKLALYLPGLGAALAATVIVSYCTLTRR